VVTVCYLPEFSTDSGSEVSRSLSALGTRAASDSPGGAGSRTAPRRKPTRSQVPVDEAELPGLRVAAPLWADTMSGHVPAKLSPLFLPFRAIFRQASAEKHPAGNQERRLLMIAHPREMSSFAMIMKIAHRSPARGFLQGMSRNWRHDRMCCQPDVERGSGALIFKASTEVAGLRWPSD